MNKTFILCDTPYQLFNGLNIIRSSPKVSFDLYIIDQFDSAKTVYDKISLEENLNNVILIKRSDSKMINHIKDYTDYLMAKINFRKLIIKSKAPVDDFHYNNLFASVLTREACLMSFLNPQSNFYLYDDGIGSYSGKITIDTINPYKMKLYKLLHVGPPFVKIKGLYVNNVSMCRSKITSNIVSLPKISDEYLHYIRNIFGDSASIPNKKIIWLTQPNEMQNDNIIVDNHVMNILKKYREEVCVRMHPRQTDKVRFEGFNLDNPNRLWELGISDTRISDNVLIGMCSSAQLTPKLLFNNEPYLIFLYPCYKNGLSQAVVAKIEENIRILKQSYSNPEKIRVVQEFEELDDILSNWK